jgi:hypothetical protein
MDNRVVQHTIVAEARWPAALAFIAVGGLYFALPNALSAGPSWLLLAIVTLLLIPAIVAHSIRRHTLNLVLGHLISAVMTAFLLLSLYLLIREVLAHREPPGLLLRSGTLLWLSNVLIFASWYWRLDAGGPHARAQRRGHETGAFLFPQMALEGPAGDNPDGSPWQPHFVYYLFLAFNTSTAFSPTDAPVLSRWAKLLMMTQSLISLTIALVLFGRAVNII